MQKHLEFVISSQYLAVRLQRIVPLNNVHYRTVLCPGKCIFKVLSILSAEITVYRVNSLLPMDSATLAFKDGDPYQ